MTTKPIRQPGPNHPLVIEVNPNRVIVRVNNYVVADTRRALTLREATNPPVHYIPIEDADTSLLERTDTTTYCPYKGDATYYTIPIGGERCVDAAWGYETPHSAAAQIKNHIAFYSSRVDDIAEFSPARLRL